MSDALLFSQTLKGVALDFPNSDYGKLCVDAALIIESLHDENERLKALLQEVLACPRVYPSYANLSVPRQVLVKIKETVGGEINSGTDYLPPLEHLNPKGGAR